MNKEVKHDHRLFTIGCSFTKYFWDTWADYVGSFYKEHINLGSSGAGNQFIATEITEAIIDYNINPTDRVVIQWSSCEREDRYLNNWKLVGSIYHQKFYSDEWIDKYTTKKHFVKRDFMLIHNVYNMLKNLKIPFVMTSMLDLFPPYFEKDIIKLSVKYAEILNEIKPSMKKIIFNNTWPEREDPKHPLTEEHIMYANDQLQGVISNEW